MRVNTLRFMERWRRIPPLAAIVLAAGVRAGEPAAPRPMASMYPGAQALREATHEIVCLVDTEHPDDVRKNLRDRAPLHHPMERIRLCLELETAGLPCLLVHASMVSTGDLNRAAVRAVVLGGRNRSSGAAADEALFALIRGCRKPLLGLGGAQGLIARAWGGTVGNLRRLAPGEPDPEPGYAPGILKETGFTAVRVSGHDPLFEGFGGTIAVMQRHSTEIRELPPGFRVLASTDACSVQALRHRDLPVYGVQFLPDRFDEAHPDGRRVLLNFFAIAGLDTARCLPAARAAFRTRTRALVREVCRDPAEMLRQAEPFVALIDMEGPEAVASPVRGSGTGRTHAGKIAEFRSRIEGELAGLPCVVVHYAEARTEHFASPKLRAVVLSGAASPSVEPMLHDLYAVIREARVPVLGICAGHQHIAKAHGAAVASMRPLRKGEADPNPRYHPGLFKEWGFLPVRIGRRDPLFEGLPDTIVVQEYHVAEVRSLPEGFDRLAGTSECGIEAIRRRDRTVYGIQFHAECYDNDHPDGRRVLQNFFRIAAGRAEASP